MQDIGRSSHAPHQETEDETETLPRVCCHGLTGGMVLTEEWDDGQDNAIVVRGYIGPAHGPCTWGCAGPDGALGLYPGAYLGPNRLHGGVSGPE